MNPAQLARYAGDPAAFRADLLVQSGGAVAKFGDLLRGNDWQRDDFAAMDPAWLRLAGHKVNVPYTRALLTRPRGHDKTQGAALSVAQPLIFSPHRIVGIWASGDRDQAAFGLAAFSRFLNLNSYLKDVLQIQRNAIVNRKTGSRLDVVSSDAPTSWGHLVDYVCLDELSVWPDAGRELFHSLFSTVEKQPDWCVLLVTQNAGFKGRGDNWQWKIFDDARNGNDWYFSNLPGPVATWIGPDALERQRRLLPDAVFRRVWLNEWTEGASDALRAEDLNAAMVLGAPPPVSRKLTYICGVDIGLTKDAAALVVVGKDRNGYKLAHAEEWRPTRGKQVSITAIEHAIERVNEKFSPVSIVCDPWQAAFLVERGKEKKWPIEARIQSGSALVEQAMALLEVFTSHTIQIYDFPPLTEDLQRLRVEERSYGFRLVSERGPSGHGDRAVALSIALAAAKDVELKSSSTEGWGPLRKDWPDVPGMKYGEKPKVRW